MADTQPGDNEIQQIALVLQGGGALGSFQGGVLQALAAAGLLPNRIAGTSIGAINGGIVAGSPPETRVEHLREFWDRISGTVPFPVDRDNALQHWAAAAWSSSLALVRGQPGFFRPNLPGFGLTVNSLGLYDPSPLRETLSDLIDFDVLNNPVVRLSVGAVSATRGNIEYFDTLEQNLTMDHIMASGALPPAFPPVRIGDELYWDGGIYSNTPLEAVLEEAPRRSTLCFVVNLWSQAGAAPQTLGDVLTREKEIRYASRFAECIEDFRRRHILRRAIRRLYENIPEERRDDAGVRRAAAHGCTTTMHIVRLGHPVQNWETASKDGDFSRVNVQQRWDEGYRQAAAVAEAAPWKKPHDPDAGVIIHDGLSSDVPW